MPSFNEIRKMSMSEIRNSLTGRSKAKLESQAAENEQQRLSIRENPYVPTLPGVNILPESTIQRRKTRQLVRKFVITGIALAVVFAACGGGAVALNLLHQQDLARIQQSNQTLQNTVNTLSPYSSYKTGLDAARSKASSTLANDINVAAILTDINRLASNNGVTYSQLSVTLSGGTASTTSGTAGSSGGGCLNPDPFTTSTSIGCITLAGAARSESSATAFFQQVNATPGFLNGFISGLTQGSSTGTGATTGGATTFNGTIAFNNAFYSQRYTKAFGGTIDQALASQGAAGKSTTTNTLASTLQQKYPTVFQGKTTANITNLASQVCTAAGAGGATATTLTTVITQSVGKQVAVTDGTAIASTIISANCATDLSKVNLASGTSGTSTAPGAASTPTTSAAPLPTPTLSGPNINNSTPAAG